MRNKHPDDLWHGACIIAFIAGDETDPELVAFRAFERLHGEWRG